MRVVEMNQASADVLFATLRWLCGDVEPAFSGFPSGKPAFTQRDQRCYSAVSG